MSQCSHLVYSSFIIAQEGRKGTESCLGQLVASGLGGVCRDPVVKFRKSRKYRNYQMEQGCIPKVNWGNSSLLTEERDRISHT